MASLTPQEEARYREIQKSVNEEFTFNTERLDVKETEVIIANFRKEIELTPEAPLIIVENPLEAWVCCYLLTQGVEIPNLVSEMHSFFHGNPKNYEIPSGNLPYQTGSVFAPFFAFYDFCIENLKEPLEPEVETYYKHWRATGKVGMIYPFPELTIVTQKPTRINVNEEGQLHCDGGSAISYDGEGDFHIYMLNGIEVPKYLAVTPFNEIDIELYNTKEYENADVKAQFIAKVGLERFLEKGKKIDSFEKYGKDENPWIHRSQYELWDMSFLFEGMDYAPYLKMLNQTTGIWHLEGVSPKCRTVADALKERFGGRNLKIVSVS